MRTYHYREINEHGVATVDEHRPVVVSLTCSGSGKVAVAVEQGGRTAKDALKALVAPYKLKWLAGREAWETAGAYGDPATHAKLRQILEADGFTVEDDLDTEKR